LTEITDVGAKKQRFSFLVLEEGNAKAWVILTLSVVLLWGTWKIVEKTAS
jgi:hypothetical protein